MNRILRLLNADERREVCVLCRARPGASGEEIIRQLGRTCGVSYWGIFPVTTDDVLLDQLGRRLGLAPLTGGPRALALREWAILACYLRQAWDAASPAQRRAVLEQVKQGWDSPTIPCPVPETPTEEECAVYALEAVMHHAAGCRALAVATETTPLSLPAATPIGPYWAGGSRPMGGHQVMYGVLLLLWRARARLLRERRARRFQLERQSRQVESLLAIRQRDLEATPASWELNPASGLAVVAAATTAVAAHLVLGAADLAALVPAAAVATAGLAWSVTAAVMRPEQSADRRVSRMSSQVDTFRGQLAHVDREIRGLELEG